MASNFLKLQKRLREEGFPVTEESIDYVLPGKEIKYQNQQEKPIDVRVKAREISIEGEHIDPYHVQDNIELRRLGIGSPERAEFRTAYFFIGKRGVIALSPHSENPEKISYEGLTPEQEHKFEGILAELE